MAEHIDFMDECKLLVEIVKQRLKHDVETATLLNHVLQQSIQILLRTPNTEELSEKDRNFIHESIRSAETALGLNITRVMQQKTRNGDVLKTTYFHDVFGAVKFEHASGTPQFQIRSDTYLQDSQKYSSTGKTLFTLRGMQVVGVPKFYKHAAIRSFCALPKHYDTNYWLILNYLVPGTSPAQVLVYFSATPEAHEIIRSSSSNTASTTVPTDTSTTSSSTKTPSDGWKNALRSFWQGSEEYCNTRMKLIPNVVDSNWMVKMAVGQRPVILGTKLQQYYFHGKNYFEIDIDMASSAMATQVLGMIRGYSKDIVVDVGITIEGQAVEELPEEILCQMRFHHVDLEQATPVVCTYDKKELEEERASSADIGGSDKGNSNSFF